MMTKTMQEWVEMGKQLKAEAEAARVKRQIENEAAEAQLRAERVAQLHLLLVQEFGQAVVNELWGDQASLEFEWRDCPVVYFRKYQARAKLVSGKAEIVVARDGRYELPLKSDESRAHLLLAIETSRLAEQREAQEMAAQEAAEAAREAKEQAEADARQAKQAEVQARVWRDFVVWQVSWAALAEEDGEKLVEIDHSFALADEPDERGYWTVVRQGEVSLQKFTHVAKVRLFEVRDPQTYPAQQVCAMAEIDGAWVRVPPADAGGIE